MQGRALFGGLVAAAGVRCLRQQGQSQALRSLNVQFIGPAQTENLHVTGAVVRAGKNITHARAEIANGAETQTLLQMSFGDDRQSHEYDDQAVDGLVPARAQAPDALTPFPYIANLTPEFTQHLEMCWTPSVLPFSGSPGGELNAWLRLRHMPESVGLDGEMLAIMLLDAPPSPVLPQMHAPAPLSSVSWSSFFQADPRQSRLDGWWFYRSRLLHAAGGFAYDQRWLWDSDGRLVAQANQVCAFFPKTEPLS